ncbi:MAG TPA: NAD(P)-dependent alcohol dehydrogenase [Intrasporangium sp.]|uniref:NAD(P)-dependent alcohol dehydrogenase n=1 Tax=Intrasporangium sp. TaxID=1925024 RepID=UPI002D78EB96|nr:NAD(P)-dependent alcohol dehydrogenase [Intrasporangium sp.]HET7397593.1 NAD(P)-dependent alcohol dehydrogenase [Intrasporangium sp.]
MKTQHRPAAAGGYSWTPTRRSVEQVVAPLVERGDAKGEAEGEAEDAIGNPRRGRRAHPEDATMQAVVQDRYGSADVLRLARIPVPTIGERDVLVEVHAAGLDRGTWHLMTGEPYLQRLALGFRGPKQPVPGRDVAGTVVAVGRAVTSFAPGDEVYGVGRGSFAELTVVREDRLARKPANVTFEQAAVVPVSGLTALHGVVDVGRVESGQKVLVTGASGGVGSYAVQLARAFGAEVTGVASTGKLDLVRSLGADHVIDYTQEDFADGVHHYDLVVDIAGRPTLSRLRRALTPTGTAVLVGGEDGGRLTGGMNRQLRALALSPFVGQRLTMVVNRESGQDLERLTDLIEAGKVTPSIDRTYPLAEVPAAMRHLEAGHARGKVAVTVRPPS